MVLGQTQLPTPKFGPSIERLHSYPVLNGRSPAGAMMSPDGSRIVFAWNQTGQLKRNLWLMEYPSGERRQILAADAVERLPNQDDARTEEQKKEEKDYDGGFGGGVTWSPDSKEFLFGFRGRTWIMDRDGKAARPLFDGAFFPSSVTYSPDGKYLVMISGSNLVRYDRTTKELKQLTFLSRPGTGINGFSISPDSKTIAVNWSDSSKFGSHIMMDFTRERSEVRGISRMWNGNRAIDAQIGLVGIDGGTVKYVSNIPRFHWLMDLVWSPDSTQLFIGWKTEDHKTFTLTHAFANKPEGRNVFVEKAPSNYINNWRPMVWTRDSKGLLLGTDLIDGKFARRSILQIAPNGDVVKRVFSEQYDVGNFMRPRDSDRIVMVTLGRSPLKSEIRILEPDGKQTVHVVEENGEAAPTDFEETGLPMVSVDGRSIATMAGRPGRNPELYAVEPKKERLTKSQLPEFDTIKWADVREVQIPGPGGVTIHAQLLTRPGTPPNAKRPMVISNMYANSGKMRWDGYLSNYLAMELGYAVFLVDFRASWGYGGEFNSGYYRKMGLIDSEEAVAVKRWAVKEGVADPDRCAVWGWSYGGFLTCMIMTTQPGEFKAGVAVASVTEWKNYNHWYTGQRLGFVDKDPKIFEETSPITYADKLQGNLLMVHGMLDDNVLFQDAVRFTMKAIDAGKRIDMMYYPRDDHGIGRFETRPHVNRTIAQYLYDKLGD